MQLLQYPSGQKQRLGEGQASRKLDLRSLRFKPACSDCQYPERSTCTPNSEQVRQPTYRSAHGQWWNFEPWLDPPKEALGPG